MNSAASHEITTAWGQYGQVIRLVPYDDRLNYLAIGWPNTDRWIVGYALVASPDQLAEAFQADFPVFNPGRTDKVIAGWGLPWKATEPLEEPTDLLLGWLLEDQTVESLLELRRWIGGNVAAASPWLRLLATYRDQALADCQPEDALRRLRGE